MSNNDFDDLTDDGNGVDIDGNPINSPKKIDREVNITNSDAETDDSDLKISENQEQNEQDEKQDDIQDKNQDNIQDTQPDEQVTEEVIEEVNTKVLKERKSLAPKPHDFKSETLNNPELLRKPSIADTADKDDSSVERTSILKIKSAKNNGNSNDGGSGGGNGSNGDSDGLIYKEIGLVMHESMIPYSEFVIMDRALPRVEDGLKPVQRRILYAMHDMGLFPDRPFRKSAGIVGECLGKYHPHGDTSVYDAMVRLAQPFNVNMPLVLGQGNFGSDDGDPPAAMRYTEAKLNPLALELLRDIDKETVPFSLTFDDRNTEPDILPGRYPNLLVNGATGIAVGLATNIPPHNLAEVIDAHIAYIDNPKITLHQVMKIIKGPDFPTGGFVVCGEELVQAYKTGKGRVVMRGKVHIEGEGHDKRNIVITELPYQVNKVQLQRTIADLRESKKGALVNISEIRDESDRKGMRIVIRVKRESDPKEICSLLFKHTNLQCNYNINMVAIANGKPLLMGLMELIAYYVNFQREVIYKRCVFDLENAKEKAHILEGLLIAIRAIDEVVRIIKTSKTTSEAKDRLRKRFELSDRQAQAILDLRLARLTSLEVYKLEEELAELLELIKKLTAIIASKALQFGVVKSELLEIKKKYKIERRSRIINDLEEAAVTADDDEKPVEDAVITLTADGTVKRMSAKHYSMSKGEFSAGMGLSDVNVVVIAAQTDKLLYVFTNLGNCYKIVAGDIPECRLRDKGMRFKEMFKDAADSEKPVAVYALDADISELDDAQKAELGELVWLSKNGMIKRSTFKEACGIQKSIFPCYKLREDKPDSVVGVETFKSGKSIMLLGSGGYILHAQTNDVPLQGRIATGVKGINIGDDEFAACNCIAKPNGFVVAVTNKGGIKKTPVKDIERMVRYRKGVKFGNLEKGENIVFAASVKGEEDLVAVCADGKIISVPVEKIPIADRTKPFKSFPGAAKAKIINAFIHRRKKNN